VIHSNFNIVSAGSYQLAFGVTNLIDNIYNSGLVFDGVTVAVVPIDPVPGPILGAGLPGVVMTIGGLLAWRRRRNQAAVT
jgi:hypothetical protein